MVPFKTFLLSEMGDTQTSFFDKKPVVQAQNKIRKKESEKKKKENMIIKLYKRRNRYLA